MSFFKRQSGFTPSLKFRQPQSVPSDSSEHIILESSVFPPALSRRQKNRSKFSAGFTLMETVVAFAIILAALIGPVSLITKGLVDSRAAKDRLIALNLAQEGIEFVRLARDNNVLCDFLDGTGGAPWPWDHQPGLGIGNRLDVSPEGTFTDLQSDAFDLATDSCGANTLTSTNFSNYNSGNPNKLRTDSSGFYQYATGAVSPYDRRISVDVRTVAGNQDMMVVTSVVTWVERGATRNVTLSDVLYYWR